MSGPLGAGLSGLANVDWGAVAKAAQVAGQISSADFSKFADLAKWKPPVAGGPSSPGNDYTYTGFVDNTGPGSLGYNNGSSVLVGPLSLPQGITADRTFTWAIQNDSGTDESGTAYSGHKLIQMTLAGALSWLRDLGVHNKDQYNQVVAELVQAGYLTPAEARLNGYTAKVGQAFLNSAVDVMSINNDSGVNASTGGGAVTTWQNHMDDLIQGRKDMGQVDPVTGEPLTGSGSGGTAKLPVEQDVYTDPETAKRYVQQAAQSVLGRNLTDAEAQHFMDAFHSTEATWNKQKYQSDLAQAQGQVSSYTSSPNPSANAQSYIETDPSLAAERTQQQVGSYLGVLRNIVGLGSGGVSSAYR